MGYISCEPTICTSKDMTSFGAIICLNAVILPKGNTCAVEKIKEINATGVAIAIVEQNAREALKMADHGYVLAMGKNVLDDTGEALLASQEVGRLYLGG